MSDTDTGQAVADGRPGAGATLAASLGEAAQKRPRSRNVSSLKALVPFVRAHWGYAAAAGFFMLFSTAATLTITTAARQVVDKGFTSQSVAVLNQTFLQLGAMALLL